MWIGEQITSRGIGNGVSLIIMAGIVARLPQGVGQLLEGSRTGSLNGVARRRHHRADGRCWCCSSASWSARSAGC